MHRNQIEQNSGKTKFFSLFWFLFSFSISFLFVLSTQVNHAIIRKKFKLCFFLNSIFLSHKSVSLKKRKEEKIYTSHIIYTSESSYIFSNENKLGRFSPKYSICLSSCCTSSIRIRIIYSSSCKIKLLQLKIKIWL